MEVEVKIPNVGESVQEVTIGNWLKKTGDYVEMDEPIAEIESDKATLELTAEQAGELKTLVNEGDPIHIGDTVAILNTKAQPPKSAKQNGELKTEEKTPEQKASSNKKEKSVNVPAAPKQGVIDVKIPKAGESVTEATVGTWMKKDGDYVFIDEPIVELESDKANLELTAEQQGELKILVQEDETVEVGAVIAKIDTDKEPPAGITMPGEKPVEDTTSAPATAAPQKETAAEPVAEKTYATGFPSPAAAKLMSENGLQGGQIKGTGKDGRITKQDVLKALQQLPAGKPGIDVNEMLEQANAFSRETEKKRMTQLRKTIAKRLVAAKNQTAMLTTFNEADMKPVMNLRNQYKKQFEEKHGVKLGFMSIFMKACSIALMEFPQVNAQIDGEEILFNDFVDISIAVSTPRGLVVPVIKNVESKSLAELEKEVIEMATKGRDGKLTMEEMTGGTFTITNGGVFGSLVSTPIINQPQSAILGMHKIQERPVALNGEVVVRPMMYLALSYDHRIIDGKESVTFLVRVKELLENPEQLLLGKNPVNILLGL